MVSVYRPINKVKQTGTTERKTGGGECEMLQLEKTNNMLRKLLLSKKNALEHRKPNNKLRHNCRRSVQRMTKDVGFKAF